MNLRDPSHVYRNAIARKRAIIAELAEVNEFIALYRKMRSAGPYRERRSDEQIGDSSSAAASKEKA